MINSLTLSRVKQIKTFILVFYVLFLHQALILLEQIKSWTSVKLKYPFLYMY